MIRQMLLVLGILSITSCQERRAADEGQKKATIKAIRQTLDNYCSDIRSQGLMAELKYLDNSADFFWNPPGYKSTISYDSVVSVLKQSAPLYKSIDTRFQDLKIIYLDEEYASYTGKLNLKMTDTSDIVSEVSLLETGLLVRRQEGWKILGGQTTALGND